VIYFIAAGSDGPIKIGYAKTSATRRLKELQTGNDRELVLLRTVDGDRATEAAYHKVFESHRLRGEWFSREPVVGFLKNLPTQTRAEANDQERVKRLWPKVLDSMRERSALTASYFADTYPASFGVNEAGHYTLYVAWPREAAFNRRNAEKAHRFAELEDSLRSVIGGTYEKICYCYLSGAVDDGVAAIHASSIKKIAA
jgi:hypothetical protein